MNADLPPLPPPWAESETSPPRSYYTEDQMREFALAAVLVERAQCAAMLDVEADKWQEHIALLQIEIDALGPGVEDSEAHFDQDMSEARVDSLREMAAVIRDRFAPPQ